MKPLLRRLFPLLFFAALSTAGGQGLPTSPVLLVGGFANGPVNVPVTVKRTEGAGPFASANPAAWPAETQLRWFFANGGDSAEVVRTDPGLPPAAALRGTFRAPVATGLGWLNVLPDTGLVLAPELSALPAPDLRAALEDLRLLAARRHFFLLLDPPPASLTPVEIKTWAAALPADLDFAMLAYPRLRIDPAALTGGVSGGLLAIGPGGAIAAAAVAKDLAEGMWKAASSSALVTAGVETTMSAAQSDDLNLNHINPIRFFTGRGYLLWGWRTRAVNDAEQRYININRFTRWTRHSLERALAPDAAASANNNTLWTRLVARSEEFLLSLHRKGALLGTSPEEGFFVRCGLGVTMSAADVAAGITVVEIGVAPLRPAEFQIMRIRLSSKEAIGAPSPAPLALLRPAAEKADLYFFAAPGFRFTPERRATLSGGPWTPEASFAGDGSWRKLTIPMDGARGFVRIRTE